uniref:Uncharacterized protein n=1 Tax=Octopus bimaculoides TaxID=37653 RepID=A0A0L8FWN6_OCTBM
MASNVSLDLVGNFETYSNNGLTRLFYERSTHCVPINKITFQRCKNHIRSIGCLILSSELDIVSKQG